MALIPQRSIKRLLVANRGEIATRIISTARELDIEVYSLHTSGDRSHTIGSSYSISLASPASYLDISELVSIVKEHNIDTVHPGYGFLSESSEFAKRMWEEAGVVVVGPGHEILVRTGDKLQARLLAEECQVPTLPALSTPTSKIAEIEDFVASCGYPIVIKAVDGGGGRGIRIVNDENNLTSLTTRALQESPSGQVFAEKAATDDYRHVEVQVIGDGNGTVMHLWERECSIQRKHQKVVEFAPSSIPNRKLVAEVINAALRMARKVNYSSLGTFEFLVRSSPPEFYFLEVNPRLQVEHTITESIALGVDLVKLQLQLAQGVFISSLPISKLHQVPESPPPIFSLQLRVTAEDAANNWSLSIGKISSFRLPAGNGVRVDSHLLPSQPTVIGTDFDSLIAKIIISAPSWKDVVRKAKRALADTYIEGVKTNLDVLEGIVASEAFSAQACHTQWLEENLSSLLELGKKQILARSARSLPSLASSILSQPVSAASSVLFRKGDSWSISLTPENIPSMPVTNATPSHLQLSQVLRNEFPASLRASVLLTTPTSQEPVSYLLNVSSTTASFGSLANSASHRCGDPGNQNHIIIPFSGKLVELLVAEGETIKKGDTVAVVRQMKMELEVRANRGGTIIWVYEGDEGDDVGQGVLLAEVGGVKL